MTLEILRSSLAKLINKSNLAEEEAADLLMALAHPEQPPAAIGAVLAALEAKGANASELRGLARAMRSLAVRPRIPSLGAPLADIAGTGADGSHSLNISTGAALLAAACGVRIAKHGNRSVSSRSGSADVIEALGIKMPDTPAAASACLAATGFTFLFAPYFHPTMKAVAPIRAALGVRTVFNLLGPLTNPAAPPYALTGAFSLRAARLIAETFSGMEIKRIFVVHSENGWDEPTPAAPFTLLDVTPGAIRQTTRTHLDFGLAQCAASELAGGDAIENSRRLGAIFEGRDVKGGRSALIMSAALLLEAVGRVSGPREGAEAAAAAIDDGRARRLIARLSAFNAGAFDVC